MSYSNDLASNLLTTGDTGGADSRFVLRNSYRTINGPWTGAAVFVGELANFRIATSVMRFQQQSLGTLFQFFECALQVLPFDITLRGTNEMGAAAAP